MLKKEKKRKSMPRGMREKMDTKVSE
jgi:hypothetical protein